MQKATLTNRRSVVWSVLTICAVSLFSSFTPQCLGQATRTEYNKAMSALLDANMSGVAVVAPDRIDTNGQLPGEGLTGAAINPTGFQNIWSTDFKADGLNDTLKSSRNSVDGAYCAGFILQVASYGYKAAQPANARKELNLKDLQNAHNFLDRWYLSLPGSTDSTKVEHQGVVAAAAVAPDSFEVRSFGQGKDELAAALKAPADLAAIDATLANLKKFDILQTWLPSKISSATEMAHTAVYVGYAPFAALDANGASVVHVRIFYWSSHYENIDMSGANAPKLSKADQVKYTEAVTLVAGRRVGYSYVDIPTSLSAQGLNLPDNWKNIRPVNSVFAMSLKLQ